MNQPLFAVGLFVFGFTLLYIMPSAQQKSWKELGSKPPAGDTVVLMMRVFGLFFILIGLALFTGMVDIESVIPDN